MDKEQVYAALDKQQEAAQVGYADGAGHDYVASQHARILEAKGTNSDNIPEATRGLERATLRLRLAMDASDTMQAVGREYVKLAAKTGRDTTIPSLRLELQSQMAMDNPEKAAAAAVVEANSPVGTPEQTKTARAWQEYQLGTVANLVGDKAWVFSTNSVLADLVPMFWNPVRTIFGQSQAGARLDIGRTGYYQFVHDWQRLDQGQQEALWDQTLAKLKEASGGNDLVFFSLIYPLIYPQEQWSPYVDAAFDILDFGITVGAWKITKLLKSKLSYRARALMHGNEVEAGKATVKGIKAGDIDAIVDGHPVPMPGVETGLNRPTQLAIEKELREKGKLAEGEELVPKGIPLTTEEAIVGASKREAALVATGAKIISKEIKPTGVYFTFEVLVGKPQVTITDLAKGQRKVERLLTDALNERKLLIAGSEPGENADALTKLNQRIDNLRRHEEQILEAASRGEDTVTLVGEGRPIIKNETMLFTEDDVGKLNFKDLDIGWYTHFLGTPESRVGKLIDGLVSYSTNMRQQQRRLFGYFDKEVRQLRKSLNSAQSKELDQLILTGDRLQRIFTPEELKAGINVDGVGSISFNDKQIEGYRALRRAYDDLYILANRMQREELIFSGYEMFFAKLFDETGTPVKDVRVFGKTRSVAFTPPENSYKSRVATVMDLRSSSGIVKGSPVELSSITDLQKQLDAKQLGFVELRTPLIQGDGQKLTYALVEVHPMGDVQRVRGALVPDYPLDYRVGYAPKLAQENIRWIVERPKEVVVDGVKVKDTVIVRGFETEAEADIFLAQELASGKGADLLKQQITPSWRNNPLHKEKVEFIDNALFKGAFVGHRTQHGVFKIGLDGREALRVSSFDALQRYADYVAAYYPMHLYKQAMIKRFIRTANEGNFLSIPGRWDSPLNGSGDEWSKLKAVQDWMKATFAVPTTEEHVFAKLTDKMLSFLEKAIYNIPEGRQRKGTNRLKALHHWVATSRSASDPVSSIKGVTFDLMLGMFNPAQFFIQSAGMLIPTTIKPIEAMRAWPEFLFIRSAMFADNYTDIAKASKALGLNPKRTGTMLHAWHRSGIPDSILENADFGHYAGTHGAYYSPSMINTFREKGRLFYNHGELNNRLFSFVMAFNSKARQHGWDLTKTLNDAQLNEVVQEALRIGTNMTVANKAKWQDGILGLPTQFWQQTHKYYENLFYGIAPEGVKKKLGLYKENQWTMAESYTALATNLVMFGAAGYGLDEWWSQFDRWLVAEDGLGLDAEKDRQTIALLRGGFAEMMTFQVMGFEVDIADRVGPASGSNIVYDKLIKPIGEAAMEGKLGEALGVAFLGPTATTLNRTLEAGKRYATLLASDAEFMTWDVNTLTAAVLEMTSVTTSITNIERALAWKAANDILNTRNLPLYIVENGQEIPNAVVWMKYLGFDPLAKEKMEKLLRQKTMTEKEKSSMARNIADEYRRFFLSREEGTLVNEMEMEIIQRRIAIRKKALLDQFGQSTMDEVMANVMTILDTETYATENAGYQKFLWNSVLNATPASETEKQMLADYEIYKELTKIRGKNAD